VARRAAAPCGDAACDVDAPARGTITKQRRKQASAPQLNLPRQEARHAQSATRARRDAGTWRLRVGVTRTKGREGVDAQRFRRRQRQLQGACSIHRGNKEVGPERVSEKNRVDRRQAPPNRVSLHGANRQHGKRLSSTHSQTINRGQQRRGRSRHNKGTGQDCTRQASHQERRRLGAS
jgi:hypothetical protein